MKMQVAQHADGRWGLRQADGTWLQTKWGRTWKTTYQHAMNTLAAYEPRKAYDAAHVGEIVGMGK